MRNLFGYEYAESDSCTRCIKESDQNFKSSAFFTIDKLAIDMMREKIPNPLTAKITPKCFVEEYFKTQYFYCGRPECQSRNLRNSLGSGQKATKVRKRESIKEKTFVILNLENNITNNKNFLQEFFLDTWISPITKQRYELIGIVNFRNNNHFTCYVKNSVYFTKERDRTTIDGWISHGGLKIDGDEGYFLKHESSTTALNEAQISNCQIDNPHILVYKKLCQQLDLIHYTAN